MPFGEPDNIHHLDFIIPKILETFLDLQLDKYILQNVSKVVIKLVSRFKTSITKFWSLWHVRVKFIEARSDANAPIVWIRVYDSVYLLLAPRGAWLRKNPAKKFLVLKSLC